MRIPRIFFLLMTTLVVSGQDTVVLRGTQRRGAPGRNATLDSARVTLKAPGSIVAVEGGRAGFWIEGSGRRSFNNPREANGVRLAAGSYQVYPNLPRDTETATVTLTIRVAPRR